MNKKEVLEIKKQFSPANCAITRICGCYVDHEKNKKFLSKNAFLSLPEEEAFKYFDIFKHTLGGTVGKNLLNLDFPLDQEQPDGTQYFLLKLRDSKLQDDELLDTFYDKVIENYEYAENYYIILIHAVYDVPGKSLDGMEMFDASDSVYEHIMMSICPVKLSKAGLSYNPDTNNIEDRSRDWLVEGPMNGLLFPAFHDRNSDIHSALFFTKKAEEIHPEFIDGMLGCGQPMTAEGQKESFHAIVLDSMGDDCDYEVMKNIHESLNEMLEEHKEDPEPLTLSKPDVKRLLEHSGAKEEHVEIFEKEYENMIGDQTSLLASNIANTKKFHIETPEISIKINSDRADLIETCMIDNRKCIVIPVDDFIEVNGVTVKTVVKKEEIEQEETV